MRAARCDNILRGSPGKQASLLIVDLVESVRRNSTWCVIPTSPTMFPCGSEWLTHSANDGSSEENALADSWLLYGSFSLLQQRHPFVRSALAVSGRPAERIRASCRPLEA